jgi:uncharacterized repeat protein (TIGR01451 family)
MNTFTNRQRRTRNTDADRPRRLRKAVSAAGVIAAFTVGLIAPHIAQVAPAAADQNPSQCQDVLSLDNGSFEQPPVPAGGNALLADAAVPGWKTSASDTIIEVWSNGFLGVPSHSGTQFAELNAFESSTLYEDVATTPGQTLSWSLAHRGRSGIDTMRVIIGPPTGPFPQSGPDISDDNTAWGIHTGSYVVPAGQTTTRFAFRAVSAASGNITVGNFIDSISFGTGPCIVADKQVQNLSGEAPARVGDTLRYSVTATNNGGTPALLTVATDALPEGVELVPGSMRITAGAGTGPLTDALDDDRGEYSATDRTVAVHLGDGATAEAGGTLQPRATTTATFDATVMAEAAGGTVSNTAGVGFIDPVTQSPRESTSQTTVTEVAPAEATVTADEGDAPYGKTAVVAPLMNDDAGPDGASFVTSSLRLIDPVSGAPVTTVAVPGEGTWTVDAATGEVAFAPEEGFDGDATDIRYVAETATGEDVTSTISVSIGTPPAAVADAVTVAVGTVASVDVLDNDVAGETAAMDYDSVVLLDALGNEVETLAAPGQGTWSLGPLGTIVFTPESGFSGTVTATYRAADTDGNLTSASVQVTVAQPASALDDDSASVAPGGTVLIDPLDNDSRVDDQTLRLVDPETGELATRVEVAGAGVFVVDVPTASVTFAADPSFRGEAAVRYSVADPSGLRSEANIRVSAAPAAGGVATPPRATDSGSRPLAATGGEILWQGVAVGILLLLGGALATLLHRRMRKS